MLGLSSAERWKFIPFLLVILWSLLYHHYVGWVCVLACMPSHWVVSDSLVTPWAVAHQASPSREFSRQEYWSRLPFPPPGNLPNPETEPSSLAYPALAGEFFTTSTTWKAPKSLMKWSEVKWSEVSQSCPTLCNPTDCVAYQASPSMGFSRQEYWSGFPFPSPKISHRCT